MALTGLRTTWVRGSYKDDRDFVFKVAENNDLRQGDLRGLRAHFDNKNSLAIGYGFDLLTHTSAEINDYLILISLGNWTLSAQDAALLDQVRAQRDALTDAQKQNPPTSYLTNLQNTANQLTLSLSTEQIAANLLRHTVDNEYETKVTQRLAQFEMTLENSKERIALVSLAYQSMTYLGPKLMAAMQNDDRAEAWYEIRYNSNTEPASIAAGVAKRRYYEADLFGLYDAGITEANMDDANAKGAFRIYTRHKTQIDAYDAKPGFADQIAAANNDFETTIVQTRPAWFQPARVYLVKTYVTDNTQISIKPVIDGDILVGEDLSTRYFKKTDIDTIQGKDANDLIFGESGHDTLKGGGGSDVIYGGIGDDRIWGEAGNDFLFGGVGNDTYYVNPGDGVDRIEDKEGNNTHERVVGSRTHGRGALVSAKAPKAIAPACPPAAPVPALSRLSQRGRLRHVRMPEPPARSPARAPLGLGFACARRAA